MRRVYFAIFMVIVLLTVACASGAATPTLPIEMPPPTETPSPPTATPEPTSTTATAIPTPPSTPTPDLSIFGDPSIFSRTRELVASLDPEAYFSDGGLQQFSEALSTDIADYLDNNIDFTLPLGEQAPALDRLQAALPGLEGGKVIPAEVDGLPPAELFVVPNMMAGPLLLFRHEGTGYTAYPILAKWAALDEPVTSAPNMWPHSAQAIDATGDGHAEALVIHSFGGASSVRYLVQILRWKGDGFDILFQAELVDWAGPSHWALVPYERGQDIELTYPVFLPGRHPKGGANPGGRQRWRWDRTVGRYILVGEAVGMPHLYPPFDTPEVLFLEGRYEEAIWAYKQTLEDESWQGTEGVGAAREVETWRNYIQHRVGQSYALLGRAREAQETLSEVKAAGGLIGELATAFLDAYLGPKGVIGAWGAVQEIALHKPSPWNRGFTGAECHALLIPPVGITAFLDRHPEAVNLEGDAFKEALADFDIQVLEASPADLDSDGIQEIVSITEGEWQQAWVAWRAVGGWRTTGLAAADSVILEEITPPDDEGRRGVVLTLEGYPSPNMKTFLWDGLLGLPISMEIEPSTIEWPVLGGWEER